MAEDVDRTEGWWSEPGTQDLTVTLSESFTHCVTPLTVRFSSYIRNSGLLALTNQMNFGFCNSQVTKCLLCLFSVPYLHSPAQQVCGYHLLPVKSSPVEFSLVLSQFLFFMHLQGLVLTSPWLESLYNTTPLFKNDYLQDWPWVGKLLKLSKWVHGGFLHLFLYMFKISHNEKLKMKNNEP